MAKQTESIDRLFLELSQFTTATTEREGALTSALQELVDLKDLKEKIEAGKGTEADKLSYGRRKPMAWAIARSLLAKTHTF